MKASTLFHDKFWIYLIIILVFMGTSSLLIAQDGFADLFDEDTNQSDNTDNRSPALPVSGKLSFGIRSFLDEELESQMDLQPKLMLLLEPSAGELKGTIGLTLDGTLIDESLNYRDIIDELYVSYFFGPGYLEAGLKKVEWGKGDGVHVIDPINPLDQSKGPGQGSNEMKVPVGMVKLNFTPSPNSLLELVYLPQFSGHIIANKGRWALIDPASLPQLTEDTPKGISGSSAALRFSDSIGGFDYGLSYYYGYKPEPGYRIETEFIGTNPMDPTHYTTSATLVNTRAHLFGTEAGWAAGPFTFRLEAGYWLTEDIDGDIPELWNNSLEFLGGIDLMIPGTDIFLSLQAVESYVMNYENLGNTDVNKLAAYDDKASRTQIVPVIEFPLAKEEFKLRLAGNYLLEARGWAAVPALFWYPTDNLEMSLKGQIFGGEKDSPFKTWDNNDNINLEIKMIF